MSSGTLPRVVPKPVSASRAIYAGLAVLLAGALLYYSLRGIEWRQVLILIAGAKLAWLGLGCGLSAGSLFLRAVRWRILLRAEGDVGISTAFWATAAGYFGNNFLPARAGELVRTLMISSRSGLSRTFVLTTALSERLADAIALVVISALVLLTLPAPPGWLAHASKPFGALGLCGVLAIAVLPRLGRLGRMILERLPMPHVLRARLMVMLEHSLRGVRAFHHPPRLIGFLALTIVIWCTDAAGMVIAAKALGLSLALPVAFLLLAGMGLGSALPSTPGYIGIYQFVAVTVLTPFGFTRTDAIAYMLLAQGLSYVMIAGWGALGFWHYRRMATQAQAS
jgi:glycosyltransferase 2 family protein